MDGRKVPGHEIGRFDGSFEFLELFCCVIKILMHHKLS